MKKLQRHSSHAGLSIEQTGVRYVSLKKKKSWELDQKRFLALPSGVIVENQIEDAEALQRLLQEWAVRENLKGKSVTLSIPPSRILIRTMSVPNTSIKQLAQLVELEVETGMHLPFENPVYDYMITSADEEQTQLLVFAAPSQLVKDYMAPLQEAGIRIAAVEFSATSLAKAVVQAQGAEFGNAMLLQLNAGLLDIYMFRGGYPVFMRTINFAMNNEIYGGEGSSVQLSAQEVADITPEISRMLNFYQYSLHDGSVRIEEIVVTGSHQERALLVAELQQSMGDLEIREVDFQQEDTVDSELNDYRMAVGAALTSEDRKSINLLPRREAQQTEKFSWLVIGMTAVWVLLMALSIFGWVSYKGTIAEQEVQIQQLSDNNTLAQLQLNKLNGGGGAVGPQAVMDAVMNYRLDAVSVLDQLSIAKPNPSAIAKINYTRSDTIQLTLVTPTMAGASAYLVKLQEMPFTDRVTVDKLVRNTALTAGVKSAGSLQSYSASYTITLKGSATAAASAAAEQKEDSNGTTE